jgi:hypothetical protein
MTIHSGVDYKCEQCGADFVPITESPNCPKCSRASEVIFSEFIDEALRSALYNIGKYRSVVPPAWGIFGTGDAYYWITFQFISFISHELKTEEVEVLFRGFAENQAQSLASKFLSRFDFGDKSYLTEHMKVYLTSLLHRVERPSGGPIKLDESLMTCFLCHSAKDKTFADKLYFDLLNRRVGCWYFPEDAIYGSKMWQEIDMRIKSCDKVIVVCSVNSLKSEPVLREMERTLQREDIEKRDILVPISIDNYLFDNWSHHRKADILAKVIADFRGWSTKKSYLTSLSRLMTALQIPSK